jgi:hypothetical protein
MKHGKYERLLWVPVWIQQLSENLRIQAIRRLEMKRLAGLSFLVILTGALAVPAQDAPTTHPYYPLKVGAEWTYEVQGGPLKMKVAKPEKVGANNAFVVEASAKEKISATEIVGITDKGVVRYSVNGLVADPPILFLPTDPTVTKEWTVDTKASGQAFKGTFKANKESVTVPAGTYPDAIHVKGSDMQIGTTSTNIDYWFVKDIGIVKLRFTLGTQEAVLELKSFTPGK